MPKLERSVALLVVVGILAGCPGEDPDANDGGSESADTNGKTATTGGTDSTVGTGNPEGTTTGDVPGDHGIAISIRKAVDILFVIDDSGSMAEEQQALAAAMAQFVTGLEAGTAGLDYRVGITTTDNGNPWCAPGAEAGQLVASSCLGRLSDFTLDPYSGDGDASGSCTDVCAVEALEVLPTPISEDPAPAVRPWFQSVGGQTNLGGGVSMAQALACAIPQGVSGCGFEAPLESMWKALVRSTTSGERSYGFMRHDAVLAVVILTDEADCSYNPEHVQIFSAHDGQVFWSNPEEDAPTSAVCWNAGVRCDGEVDGAYTSCASANLDMEAHEVAPADAADAAALHPVARYVDFLQQIEEQKKALSPNQEVLVSVIAGVPLDYPTVPIPYPTTIAESTDPDFLTHYGIGPGCVSAVAEAVPPVRLAEVAGAFLVSAEDSNLSSVCATDYTQALQAVLHDIHDQFEPACMPACVADVDPTTPGLDPSCVLTQVDRLEDGSRVETPIPRCDANGVPPVGSPSCYIPRTGPEEMDPQCVNEGWNLEFEIISVADPTTPGFGEYVSASCELSTMRHNDCPALP